MIGRVDKEFDTTYHGDRTSHHGWNLWCLAISLAQAPSPAIQKDNETKLKNQRMLLLLNLLKRKNFNISMKNFGSSVLRKKTKD